MTHICGLFLRDVDISVSEKVIQSYISENFEHPEGILCNMEQILLKLKDH